MNDELIKEINIAIDDIFPGLDHRALMNEIKNAFLEYIENGDRKDPLLISKYKLTSLNDAIAKYSGMAGQSWYIRMVKRAEEIKIEMDAIEKDKDRIIEEKRIIKSNRQAWILAIVLYVLGFISNIVFEAFKKAYL